MDRSIAPAISDSVSLSMLPIQQKKLKNGINVSFVNGGSQEILKVELIYDAGSKYQSKPLQAAIGFDLLREGTTSKTGNEFTEAIDLLGGFLSTESTKDFGTITIFVLNKNLKQLLDLVTEMLTSPRFEKEDFTRLVKNQENNFLINLEKTSFLAKQKLTERLFANSVYGRVAVKDSFADLTYDEVVEYMNSNVVGSACDVLVSGKVTAVEEKLIATSLGSLQVTNAARKVKVEGINSETGLFEIEKDNEQCSVCIGKVMPNKDHKDTHDISIVNTIFGGYFGSRLMQNIREDKGWTYGMSSAVFSYEDTASLAISGDVLKDKGPDTLVEIKKELDRLQSELVSEKELSLVKNYLKGKLLKSFDGPFEQADRFFTINSFGLTWDFYQDYIKAVESITPKKIQEIAQEYFRYEDLSIVTAG